MRARFDGRFLQYADVSGSVVNAFAAVDGLPINVTAMYVFPGNATKAVATRIRDFVSAGNCSG